MLCDCMTVTVTDVISCDITFSFKLTIYYMEHEDRP